MATLITGLLCEANLDEIVFFPPSTWDDALLEFTQNRGGHGFITSASSKFVKQPAPQQTTPPASKGFKGAKGAGKNKKVPRDLGNPGIAGYLKCEKGNEKKILSMR